MKRMADKENLKHDSVGAWAKRLYFAARSVMDSVLRPYGLGSTQWYVLYQLANRRTNDAARSGAHAPDREGHAERDRGDIGAQGSRRSNAGLRGPTSTDASHHPFGHEALERVARSYRRHPGSCI